MRAEKISTNTTGKSLEYYESELKVKRGSGRDKKKGKNMKNIKSFFQGVNLQESLSMVEELEQEELL